MNFLQHRTIFSTMNKISDLFYVSKRELGNCDFLMIDFNFPNRNVPTLIDQWLGTGTVMLESLFHFCVMI